MCRDPKLASHWSGNGFSEHREARRPSPTDPLSQTLQRSCGRHHSRSHLYAAKDGVLRRNDEIAGEGKLEAAAKRDALDGRDGRHLQSFDRAIG